VGIDTGGTFTDVVAFDEDTGELARRRRRARRIGNPADGFIAGIEKILGHVLGATGTDITAVSHGTTVATNKLLEGKVERLGFITTEGYEFMLEIARQAVPDGYGNSYFWVKPPRIVEADRVRTVGGRMDFEGNELRPFDEADAVAAARWFRERGITTLGVCFLHSYANDAHELAMREVLRREHPEAVVSISSQVLREYREYERSMTTLVDAAVKPNVSRYVKNIHERLDAFLASPAAAPDPVLRHEVQRRGAVRRRGRAPADHHRALRPGRRGPRGRAHRPSPASTRCSPATAAAPPPTSRSSSTVSRR
jgi:N-methylhydantoinase A